MSENVTPRPRMLPQTAELVAMNDLAERVVTASRAADPVRPADVVEALDRHIITRAVVEEIHERRERPLTHEEIDMLEALTAERSGIIDHDDQLAGAW